MTLAIQRPGGGPDVTRRNKRDVLYIKGDETTDGSIRIIISPADDDAHIELRASGSWNDTSFRFSSGSVEIGRDLKLQAAADFLKTQNPSGFDTHDIALVPHIPFTPNGTLSPHTPILDTLKTESFFTTPVSEIIATTISQVYTITFAQIINSIVYEAGSLSSSNEVEHSIYEGSDNTGVLISRKNLPASDFTANLPVLVEFDSDIGFSENHLNIFIEMVCVNSFSLKTDISGNIITEFETQALETRDLVYEDLVLGNDLSITFDNNLNFVFHQQFN